MKQFNNDNFRNGFTLVEILVTATIIGLLSTIGISGFQAITRSSRDALRKTELEQIRSALEIYKSENQKYPTATTSCFADLTSAYINPYPSDPSNTTYAYCYVPAADPAMTYDICAHLENGNASDNCGGTKACGGGTNGICNYKLSNP